MWWESLLHCKCLHFTILIAELSLFTFGNVCLSWGLVVEGRGAELACKSLRFKIGQIKYQLSHLIMLLYN
jgi:hypothetical protein